MIRGYMFDTNIFGSILANKVDFSALEGKECYTTHIQYDEIQATKDLAKRTQLERVFTQIRQLEIPTESFVLGVSRLDGGKLSNGTLYDNLIRRLNKLNKKKPNNSQDILIAETAIVNELVLVTHDRDLFLTTTEFGGATCNLNYVLKL